MNIIRPQEEILQIAAQNNIIHGTVSGTVTQETAPSIAVSAQPQNRSQGAIVIQHQGNAIPAQTRQIVTAIQPQTQQTVQQQQFPTVTISSRSARSSGQGGQRASRSSNKEQGGGRSRSSTKEPPGAVNLERSYQICQAVSINFSIPSAYIYMLYTNIMFYFR